jgi:hypothetical protein
MTYETCEICGTPVNEDEYPYCKRCDSEMVEHMIEKEKEEEELINHLFTPSCGTITE